MGEVNEAAMQHEDYLALISRIDKSMDSIGRKWDPVQHAYVSKYTGIRAWLQKIGLWSW